MTVKIKEVILNHLHNKLEKIKDSANLEKIAKGKKLNLRQSVDYIANRLMPFINEDLDLIEKAYIKGMTNSDDGVFLISSYREDVIALSLEVAKSKELNNTKLKKLNENELIEIIKETLDGKGFKFVQNISFLEEFSGSRKKEVWDEFWETFKIDGINGEKLKYDNTDEALFDESGNEKLIAIREVNIENIKKRLKAIEYNTPENGWAYKRDALDTLGVFSKDRSGYKSYQINSEIDGFVFSRGRENYRSLMYHIIENSPSIYSSKNIELLSKSISYISTSLYQMNNDEMAFEYPKLLVNKILDNIKNFKGEDLNLLLINLNSNFRYVNPYQIFIDRINNLTMDELNEITLDTNNDTVSLFVKGAKNNWSYSLDEYKRGNSEDGELFVFIMKDLKEKMYLSSLFNFQEIFDLLSKDLKLQIKKDEKKDTYSFNLPASINFDELMGFCRKRAIQELTKDRNEKLDDVTSNMFYEYVLSKKLEEIDVGAGNAKRIKRKV